MREKFSGFYKGMSPLLYRETVYSIFHYSLYRYLKEEVFTENGSWSMYFLPATVAGVAALLISHPFEVIRTRLQSGDVLEESKRYGSVREAITKINKTEGSRGYFKGLFPRLIRKPINSGVTWMAYELLLKSKTMERF